MAAGQAELFPSMPQNNQDLPCCIVVSILLPVFFVEQSDFQVVLVNFGVLGARGVGSET